MDKVIAKQTTVLNYGSLGKCVVHISQGQRWYIVVKPDVQRGRMFYTLERDNVTIEVSELIFDSIFKPSVRGANKRKWE